MNFYFWKRYKGTLREDHAIYWHSQNLNDKPGGLKGSKWRHGRGWLHLFDNSIAICWAFFWNSSTAIGVTLGGEEDLKLHVAIWRLFSFWFSMDTIMPRKWRKDWKWWDKSWGRTTDIRIFDGYIWFNIHNDTTGWSNKQPWWMEFNWCFQDFFLGKTKHSSRILESGETVLAFIEDNYPIKWQKTIHEWHRPRWFTDRVIKYDLDMKNKPIPIPGKGENSYDCEDDAIYSTHVSANNLAQALSRLTESVLRTRAQYGWIDSMKDKKL